MLRALTFTSLYPNTEQPYNGVFVERRLRAMADRMAFEIIAPISLLQQWHIFNKVPHERYSGNIMIHHPRYTGFPKIMKWMDGYIMYLCTQKSVRSIVESFKPDYIDAHYAYPDGYAAMLHAKFNNIPFTLTLRGSDLYLVTKDIWRRNLIAKVLKEAMAVIALSEDLKQMAVDLGASPNKISVISNGVDQSLFKPFDVSSLREQYNISPDSFVLLGVGRLVPLKRFDLLVAIIASLKKRMKKPIHGIIVGSGPEEARLRKLSYEYGLENDITFVGQQFPGELPRWYNLANILMVLSTHEGSPNAPLEALSCGTPVIATAVGNLPDIIDNGSGLILRDLNSDNIANAVALFWKKNVYDRSKIRLAVSDFTWEAVSDKQVSFIKKMIKNI